MQLNLTTDYALRSLLTLGGGGEISSQEISQAIGIERDFTLKVLRQLREGGFVEATKGKKGGYYLTRPLSEISLLDVLVAMEDTMRVNRCLEDDHFCSRHGVENGCPANRFYRALQSKLEGMLGSITLQDVLEESYDLS